MSWSADFRISDRQSWPDAVYVFRINSDGERRYVPERTATIVKVPRKDYISIGHYECGGCGATIDAGDRFCRKCGVRLEGADE